MKTISEQIADLEATRAAKAGRMTEMTNKTLGENRTKDAAESEEFSTLKDEIKSIDAELVDLRDLEVINVSKATAVPSVVPGQANEETKAATASRGGSNIVVVERKLAPGVAFARLAGVMAHAKGNMRDAMDFASNRFPEEKGMQGIIKMFSQHSFEDVTKAAVAVGTTAGTTCSVGAIQPDGQRIHRVLASADHCGSHSELASSAFQHRHAASNSRRFGVLGG
jgi:hypothetical protein